MASQTCLDSLPLFACLSETDRQELANQALYPGLYIYHCASPVPNIPAHIANGMYGLILVDPREGLPAVDHEYAILESEFFTMPSSEKGIMELSLEKGLAEHPDYVVFNPLRVYSPLLAA